MWILIGGMPSSAQRSIPKGALRFFDKRKKYRAYLLPYARQYSEWYAVTEKYDLSFKDEHIKLNSILLPSQQSVDYRQLDDADILVIPGGDTQSLLKHIDARLAQHIKQFAAHKPVIASSAGVNMLSRMYYRNDDKTFSHGCGIIPLDIVVHARPELKQQYVDQYEAARQEVPSELLLLAENEVITYGK